MSLRHRSHQRVLAVLEGVAALCVVGVALGTAPGPLERTAENLPTGPRASVTGSSYADPGESPLFGPLPFHYDLHTFRGANGSTSVVAAVALQVRDLGRERVEGRVRYRFDVRFVLADTLKQDLVDTIDSVFVSVPQPLARRHLLHTTVELRARPSTTIHQRIVVTDAVRPGYGQLQQSAFEIPDYGGTDLMLSSVAFGLPGVRGSWTRRGVTLALLPTSQFPESAFDVYYEIYNLPRGTPYETEIAIEPVDDEDREDEDAARSVRTVFHGESDAGFDGIVGELRRVESALDEGRYRVSVTVTDGVDGRTATTSRVVEVQGWRPGTTMVPALPKRGRVAVGG